MQLYIYIYIEAMSIVILAYNLHGPTLPRCRKSSWEMHNTNTRHLLWFSTWFASEHREVRLLGSGTRTQTFGQKIAKGGARSRCLLLPPDDGFSSYSTPTAQLASVPSVNGLDMGRISASHIKWLKWSNPRLLLVARPTPKPELQAWSWNPGKCKRS